MALLPSPHALEREISLIKQSSLLATKSPLLLAVSKGQGLKVIEEYIKNGFLAFGENRVQEAQDKWQELLNRYPQVALHLIGPLQTNKVKTALALFDVIQTLDRPKLAEAIAKARDTGCAMRTKYFYVQVNTGEEAQKAGVAPKDADAFIHACKTDWKLPVVGLMCIPPAEQPSAPHFALLRDIATRNNLRELSMGMSDDWQTAIRMGSTCIRLGRALFGERV